MNLLIPNLGSTSLKYQILEMPSETVLAKGRLERVTNYREAIARISAGAAAIDAVGLKAGDYEDFARQKESAAKIADLYRRERYQFAEAEREEKVNADQNTVDITFTVKEADPVAVGVPSITIVPAEALAVISPLVLKRALDHDLRGAERITAVD